MKKFLSLVLALALTLVCVGASAGILDSFESFLVQTQETISGTLEDAGNGASDAGMSLREALNGLWDSITGYTDDIADWISGFVAEKGDAAREALENLKNTFGEAGNITEDILKQTFAAAVEKLDIDAEGAERIWETVKDYAEEHDISILSVGKLALTAVVQAVAGTDNAVGESAEASLQNTLTQWLENSGVTSEETADEMLSDIEAALKGVE